MRKIINNKLYDITTAEYLTISSSFEKIYEEIYQLDQILYITKKGNYFLCKDEIKDGKLSNDSLIIPLTVEEAKEWFMNCGELAEEEHKYLLEHFQIEEA